MKKKYIIAHWTAGNYIPNQTDLTHYQKLIDGAGKVHDGQEKTASTGGMNSITYNVSCCGRKDDKTPIKQTQFESMCHCIAMMCHELKLTPKDVYTHYEIGKMVQSGDIKKLLPYNKLLEQNIGKRDFNIIDFDKKIKPEQCGDYLRDKVNWYYLKCK